MSDLKTEKQTSSIEDRITAWVGSSNCWCGNDSDGIVYCTPCEIMLDALERIEYLESLIGKKIEAPVYSAPAQEGAIPEVTVGH